MAESESTTTAGDAEEPTALISHTFLDEEKACWHAPDVRSDLLLVFPVPLSPITMEHRVTKETMSPIQTANTHDPSRQADPTPQTMDLRRSTRSHAFKRKIIGFKEEDTSPLIDNYDDEDEDAVSAGSGGDPSVEKSTGALVNLAGKIPLKKPRHKKASKKDEPESQRRAAAAAVTGPSDGTVNTIIMTMGAVRGTDSGYQCTAVATSRQKVQADSTVRIRPNGVQQPSTVPCLCTAADASRTPKHARSSQSRCINAIDVVATFARLVSDGDFDPTTG
jgi:hypothetical protein